MIATYINDREHNNRYRITFQEVAGRSPVITVWFKEHNDELVKRWCEVVWASLSVERIEYLGEGGDVKMDKIMDLLYDIECYIKDINKTEIEMMIRHGRIDEWLNAWHDVVGTTLDELKLDIMSMVDDGR